MEARRFLTTATLSAALAAPAALALDCQSVPNLFTRGLCYVFDWLPALGASSSDYFLIYAKLLIFVLVLALFYFGSSKVFVGDEHKNIRVVVSVTLALISTIAMPGRLVIGVVETYSVVIGALLMLLFPIVGIMVNHKVFPDNSPTHHVMRSIIYILIGLTLGYFVGALAGLNDPKYASIADWGTVGVVVAGILAILNVLGAFSGTGAITSAMSGSFGPRHGASANIPQGATPVEAESAVASTSVSDAASAVARGMAPIFSRLKQIGQGLASTVSALKRYATKARSNATKEELQKEAAGCLYLLDNTAERCEQLSTGVVTLMNQLKAIRPKLLQLARDERMTLKPIPSAPKNEANAPDFKKLSTTIQMLDANTLLPLAKKLSDSAKAEVGKLDNALESLGEDRDTFKSLAVQLRALKSSLNDPRQADGMSSTVAKMANTVGAQENALAKWNEAIDKESRSFNVMQTLLRRQILTAREDRQSLLLQLNKL